MRHSTANKFWSKVRLVAISAVYVMFTAQVKADDTEIYIANAAIAPVQPNILFVMDTSGSMSLPPVADLLAGNFSAPSKISQMKLALTQLINNLNNVNVGLMRFSAYENQNIYEAGGPVLYPVRDINAGVDPLVFSYIANSSDDGVETPYGGVKLNQGTISMTEDKFDCPSCRITLFEPVSGNNNIILGNQTNPALAVLGDDGNFLGLRYQVDIPKKAKIFSARIIFTAAPDDGSAKFSENLKMSHDWRKANYSSVPADTAPFTNGVLLDTTESTANWHGRRTWNGGTSSAGSDVPVFVDGNEFSANVFWSLDWSVDQSNWEEGDHIMYRFYRERIDTTPCTANCGTAPIIELVPGFLPPSIPQPDSCAAPVCTSNCGTAPIIELVAGFWPTPIPQPDSCAAAVCTANCGTAPIIELIAGFWPPSIPQPDSCAAPVCTDDCGTAPIIELVPGFWPPSIPQPDSCAAPVCSANCGTAPIIELVAGFWPPSIPQPDTCAAPVCTANCGSAPIIELVAGFWPPSIPQPDSCAAPVCSANCGTAPIIELVAGFWPAPVPQPDTCIPDGEGGQNCFANPDVQPPFVDPVMGPDPSYIPVFDPPVCTPVADVQPPFVDPVMGPDPSYIPVFDPPVCTPVADVQPPFVDPVMGPDPAFSPEFAPPVCTPVADVQPPFVDPVMGPDPTYIPVFAPPVCTPVADVQPPFVAPVMGPDPTYIPVFDPAVCTPVADIQPPFVPAVMGPDPTYIPVFTPTHDFPTTKAIRNAHGLQSGTPPVLEVKWLADKTKNKTALRFDEVFVPQGATITSAFIEFETISGTTSTSLNIRAEKVANSAPLIESSFNIGSRPLTASVVPWNNIINWSSTSTDHKTTPNVKALVQEVVSQGGWCAGNALTFVLDGTGKRKFKSWDNSSGAVPRLKIRYDESSAVGGCNATQTSSKVASEAEDVQETTAGSALAGFFPVGSIQSLSGAIYDGLGNQSLRFQNIQVPQGAVIKTAYIVKTALYKSTFDTTTTVRGVDLDNMAPFTFASGEISALPKVTATASWNLKPWIAGKRYKSDDITAVVQAIVNRSGWEEGNALGILVDDPGEPWKFNKTHVSVSGGNATAAPQLVISYESSFELGARTVREELVDLVAGLTAQGSTPISGVMAEAAAYYRGEDVYFGQNRGFATNDVKRRFYRTSNPISYTGGTVNLPVGCYDAESSIKECHGEMISGIPVYQSPIVDICQTNNIVLLSDGIPNTHFPIVETIIKPIIQGDANTTDGFPGYPLGCANGFDGRDCTLKLSEAMANEDQESLTLNGIQTVQTHTIGFDLALGGSASQFLEDLATVGKGGSYSADNAGSLVGVFEAIVRSLERESRTFVSAGVSVNQANRLTHRSELYFGLFRPDTDTTWSGNLKRYQLSNGIIKDVNVADAVNDEGRFKDLAKSFWSDVIDGDAVEIGGVASKMTNTRNVYSNITSDPLTDANNKVTELNVNITDMDVAAVDAADRSTILRWARGVDAAGNARTEMGDPLHSRPVVVTYDDGTPSGSPVVFVGTNQGYLHAIDTGTGIENWSFIPKELLQNITLFEKNTVVASHVYGLDGEITLLHDDVDQDSLIDTGETAIIYVGMRRGGRNYYAIDISNRLAPDLKFVIQGGVGSYAELGQSWSRLTPGKIKFNGSDRKVLTFSGGYDTNQDNMGAHVADTVGRTIYIADALTGALLWDARTNNVDPVSGTSAVSNLTNSIPADVKAVDLSGSGYIEHIYASDTAGQVFRFDIDNFGNTGTADLAVGGRIAHLQTGAVVEENNRRFYYAPDVSAIKRPNYDDFIAVSIGSGYRAHPVNNNTNDKFYVIRDSWVLQNNSFPNLPGDIEEDDLADVSSVIGDLNGDGVSDSLALIENASTPKHGWLMDFRQIGEKVLAESITFNAKVIFTTYRPNLNGAGSGVCAAPEGSSRAYVLNLIDGSPAIDTNTDGDLDDLTVGDTSTTACGDRCIELGRGIPSRGLVLFQPEGATICFGTQCFDNMLAFQGDRLQRVKWRKRSPD